MLITACGKISGPAALFKKQSPRDEYAQSLKNAGLSGTQLGNQWLTRGDNSLNNALPITIPYKETGYFAPEKVQTVALRFEAQRGQKLRIALSKRPVQNFKIYADLFEQQPNEAPKIIAFADTAAAYFEHEVEKAGTYYLRLQPELLSGGEYTLTITAGPSLSFPVSSSGKPRIGSFWGDGRDDNARKHEGIDIFATKRTPAIAAANGTVTSVTENNLGGLVVFMRPDEKDYTLYYAHLDAQLARPGQTVKIGDTLGLVGNTGNAKNTASHLHFGIYTNGGAIDPLKFVDRDVKSPKSVTAALNLLNTTVRTKRNAKVYSTPSGNVLSTEAINTPLIVNAAADDRYKVTLPDGRIAYIADNDVVKANALKSITLKSSQVLYTSPDSITATPTGAVNAQDKVNVLGTYKNYNLVKADDVVGWILVQ